MTCNDPFVEKLEEIGYRLITYPKTSIKALQIYESKTANKLIRLFVKSDLKHTSGNLKTMFKNHSGEIGISIGEGIDIETRMTQKISANLGVGTISSFLKRIFLKDKKVTEQEISAKFSNTQNVVFKINEIETIDADEIALRNWLNDNQKELRETHKDMIEKGTYYVATSLLKAKKIVMSFERKNEAELAAKFDDITQFPIAGASLKVKSENTKSDKLLFDSPEGILIGIKFVRLIFSPKGILTTDNKQDFNRVLSEKPDSNYYENTETFIDIE